eukprot:GFUD01001207.1.p1 GENE.GFUD01001207.1~~GFUD01001207.1.p1  ORF type:complete len:199 (+),score=22.91 GFUD01001207.1:155-751(+)
MAVWSMSYTLDVAKTIRKTNILLRIFLCFDVFFLISSILNLLWISPTQAHNDYLGHFERAFILCIIGIFTTSIICNSLAIFGVSTWKRGFLIPWLVFFLAVKIFLVLGFISNILHRPVNLGQLILLILILGIMSAWRHMQVQYILMGLPPPSPGVADAETGSSGQNGKTAEGDLPPKYEDVAETPPKYDEATMNRNDN